MLRKYRTLITVAAVVLVLAMFVGTGIHHFNSFRASEGALPVLSAGEKEKVAADIKGLQITWYDENDGKEEPGVWLYLGTYGDCYAFLMYECTTDAIFNTIPLPIELEGLSWPVLYHHNASVILYRFSSGEIYTDEPNGENSRNWAYLKYITDGSQWITDEQLEALTLAVEDFARGRVHCPDGHLIDPRWEGVCSSCQKDSKQPVPQSIKDDLKEAYGSKLVWYDENGGVEEAYVWRYIGKYGDNYAFLRIRWETDEPGEYRLEGISDELYYPYNAVIMLYNEQKKTDRNPVPCDSLLDALRSGEWMTHYQLSRLTKDVEKIVEEHQ